MNLRRALPFLLVALPLPAFASSARVGARIADLRAEPSSDAKSKAKLPSGRDVEVIGKSDDGQWVRVRTECPKANETIKFEGWLAVREVQGANLDGLAVAGSSKKAAPAAASDEAWGDSKPAAEPAKTDTASAKDEWGNDAGKGSEPAAPAAAAKSDDSWDTGSSSTPAAAPAASSGDGWGDSDSSSSSSSAAPAGGDEWSSGSSDSGSSSSSSSGDGW